MQVETVSNSTDYVSEEGSLSLISTSSLIPRIRGILPRIRVTRENLIVSLQGPLFGWRRLHHTELLSLSPFDRCSIYVRTYIYIRIGIPIYIRTYVWGEDLTMSRATFSRYSAGIDRPMVPLPAHASVVSITDVLSWLLRPVPSATETNY